MKEQILIHQQNIENWNNKARELFNKSNSMAIDYSISTNKMIETIDRALEILEDVKFEEYLLKNLLSGVDIRN